MPNCVLTYVLAPDYLERRAPFKDGHMRHVAEATAAGAILLAGAYGMPPAGAMFVFADEPAAMAFARADPYVAGGVATSWTTAPWLPIAGPGAA